MDRSQVGNSLLFPLKSFLTKSFFPILPAMYTMDCLSSSTCEKEMGAGELGQEVAHSIDKLPIPCFLSAVNEGEGDGSRTVDAD